MRAKTVSALARLGIEKVHRAGPHRDGGRHYAVRSLCAGKTINMRRELWTVIRENVTCERCVRLMRAA